MLINDVKSFLPNFKRKYLIRVKIAQVEYKKSSIENIYAV